MDKDFKISVIIPAHNTDQCIERAIKSLKDQTYSNFEAIIVNDGSTDDTKRTVRRLIRDDSRFGLYNFSDNRGVSEARNFGMRAATGDIVCCMDSDDEFIPIAFEKIVKEFKTQSPDVLVFGADVVCDEQVPTWLTRCLTPVDHITYYGVGNIDLIFKARVRPFSWRVAIDRQLLIDHPTIAYDEELVLGEDQVFLFELYLKSSKTLLISDHLYKYAFKREGSAMASHDEDYTILDHHATIVQKVVNLYVIRKSRLSVTDYEQLYLWTDRFCLGRLHEATTRDLPGNENSSVIANAAFKLAMSYMHMADWMLKLPVLDDDVSMIRGEILTSMSECYNIAAEYGRLNA